MEGWISLHRKIMDSVVWTDPTMIKLWLLCLMKASHKDQPNFSFAGQQIPLKAGEFITGREALAKEFNSCMQKRNRVSAITLHRLLKKFEKFEMLNIKATNKYSVISVVNWHLYQDVEQQVIIKRTTSEQQVNTNNNVNNDNNDNNDNNKTLSSPKPTKPKRKARVYGTDSIYYILAEELFKQICQNQEIRKPNLNAWADDIRKMIEIDKRTESQVRRMIAWSQKNEFWSAVILSSKKLRAKYDIMAAQANRDYQQKNTSQAKPAKQAETVPEWMESTDYTPADDESTQALEEAMKKLKGGAAH